MFLGVFGKILAKLFKSQDAFVSTIQSENLDYQIAILAK
jgi:hypothetical protein